MIDSLIKYGLTIGVLVQIGIFIYNNWQSSKKLNDSEILKEIKSNCNMAIDLIARTNNSSDWDLAYDLLKNSYSCSKLINLKAYKKSYEIFERVIQNEILRTIYSIKDHKYYYGVSQYSDKNDEYLYSVTHPTISTSMKDGEIKTSNGMINGHIISPIVLIFLVRFCLKREYIYINPLTENESLTEEEKNIIKYSFSVIDTYIYNISLLKNRSTIYRTTEIHIASRELADP